MTNLHDISNVKYRHIYVLMEVPNLTCAFPVSDADKASADKANVDHAGPKRKEY
jgi:hypothetical protein